MGGKGEGTGGKGEGTGNGVPPCPPPLNCYLSDVNLKVPVHLDI